MCFKVWISPQRQSGSVSSPHLWRLSFIFPSFDLALFKVTQSFLTRFEPGGSFSSGFGRALFCCLLLYSRQRSILYEAAWLGLISCTVTKLLWDLSLRLTSWCPYIECLGSFSCLCRSIFVIVLRWICGGEIPVIRYRAGMGVGLRTPVIIRYALFSSTSILWAWHYHAHTGAQYFTVEWHSASTVCLRVLGSTPQLVVVSLLTRLVRDTSFPFSFVTCSLNESILSRVTPR